MAATHVQTKSGASASATTITVTLDTAPTAGHFLMVTILWDGSTPTGISQPQGDTATTRVSNNVSGLSLQQRSVYNCTAATAYQFSWTGAVNVRLFVSEFSGVATASAFDQSANRTAVASAVTTFTVPDTGTTATLAQADELVYVTCHADGSFLPSTFTVDTGFTVPTNGNQVDQTTMPGGVAYKNVSSTSGVSCQFNLGDTGTFVGVLGTYKNAAAGTVALEWGQPISQPTDHYRTEITNY